MSQPAKEAVVKGLFKVGAHFGFSRARRHPSVNKYIFGYKNKTAVIDLEKTADSLEVAKDFVRKVAAEGKQVLFVGNKNEARAVINRIATSINMPFVAERWIGGTFTNFKQMRKRVDRLVDLRTKTETGGLSMYTKKERGVLAKEVETLERYFSSVVNMEKLPGAVFLIDVKQEHIAVAESHQLRIPIISLSGSDCNIEGIEYPIIGNDAARSSIEHFAAEIAAAYTEGKAQAAATAAAAAEKPAVAPVA